MTPCGVVLCVSRYTRYVLRHPHLAAIDTGGILFLPLHDLSAADIEIQPTPTALVLTSHVTNSTPALVHGNGSGCYLLQQHLLPEILAAGWPPRYGASSEHPTSEVLARLSPCA